MNIPPALRRLIVGDERMKRICAWPPAFDAMARRIKIENARLAIAAALLSKDQDR